MRKTFGVLLFVGLAFLPMVSSVYAEETKEMGMMSSEKGSKGMMGGKMMGMHLMKMMMDKSVVATSDGGVVVVTGNKITKYDKDLNVVKEAEIKMDMAAMEKNMKEMMEKCPMMKDMGNKTEAPSESSADEAASAEDHQKHH